VKRNRVPRLVLDPARESLVSSSGGVLLRRTVELSGLERRLSVALSPWRSSRAAHDPGKVLLEVATAVALGGDCLADVAVVRAQPEVFGSVASDPTVSRLVAALAGDVDAPWGRSGPRVRLLGTGSGTVGGRSLGSRVGR
jgi:hypothetical protein